jgi:hypothetical protein
VFGFSLQILSETFFYFKRNSARYYHKCTAHRSSCKVPVILVTFSSVVNFLDRFRKSSNINFYENPSSGSRVVPCGQTDRQTDMTKLIVTSRNFSKAPRNVNKSFTLPRIV